MLVVGASGGVGSLAVAVGAKLGAEVTGIASRKAADFVRSLGASSVLVRGEVDPLADTRRYHVILDAAAAHSFGSMRHLLEKGGVYIATLPSPGLLLAKALAPLFGKRAAFISIQSTRACLEQLAAWALEGMKVPIDSRFPVRDVALGLARLAKAGILGRVVIDVEDGF